MMIRMMCNCMVELGETVKQDEEGFVICPFHGQRRYGYLSAGRDHSRDGWTPLQLEHWELYGIAPVLGTFEAHAAPQDRRDNRDPEEVARKVQIPHGSYQRNLEREMDKQGAGELARIRLDLFDKSGYEIRDTQVS